MAAGGCWHRTHRGHLRAGALRLRVYLPRLRAEFALSASTAGTLASVSYASYCLAIFLGAVFTARGAARGTAILAGATATVGMGLVVVSHSTKELGVGVAIAGASAGLSSPPLVALVASGVRPAFQKPGADGGQCRDRPGRTGGGSVGAGARYTGSRTDRRSAPGPHRVRPQAASRPPAARRCER
jgi:hypothetical protein